MAIDLVVRRRVPPRPDPRDGDAPLRRARLPGHARGGHRRGGRHRKGTVFLDFGSKEGLFLETFKRAVSELPAWLDAPKEVVEQGFWAVLDWWLQRAEEHVASDPVPNRVALVGRYDTNIDIRRPIDRFMRSEDPYGTLEFVEFGVARGEVRDDVDVEMIASILDWMAERFQDAIVSEDFDPG